MTISNLIIMYVCIYVNFFPILMTAQNCYKQPSYEESYTSLVHLDYLEDH